MKKIFFLSAAVVLLAAGCNSQTSDTANVGTSSYPPAQSAGNNNTQTPQTNYGTNIKANANSNDNLNSSLNGIDSQMNGLNSDSANIDSSMNAQ